MSSTATKIQVAAAPQPPPEAPSEYQPHIAKPLPLLQRIRTAARLWFLKIFVICGLRFIRLISPAKVREVAPTYSKAYDAHPGLPCRFFLPKDYKAGSKLPLYIDIHGGGFALCDPQTDDKFCRHFADVFGYCVVSINYRKAPLHRWPVPVEDCADLAKAVLADQDLPVDHEKVIMGGFSAGGNLCLAIAQLDGIRERIKGLIPFYPSCDFTGRNRGEFKPNKQGKADLLKHSSALFNWGYVPVGVDRKQPTLSPVYATRKQLPQKMYFVGAEYDVLCQEANIMAKNLAGLDKESDPGSAWQEGGIRWEMVPDVQHGFTHVPMRGEEGRRRKILCDDLYKRIDEWIKAEVL